MASYRRCLRDFLVSRGDAVSPAELVALSADDLLAFSRQRGAGLGRTAWNHLATALSGFYRWLDLCGHGGAQLVGAVPLRRRYRLADVPCALSWEQVRRLLGAVDLREPNGRRNYAVLLLIASYGLRGCEVRALRLDDIDWAHDEIVIFAPKTGRRRALPLTRPAGEAVLDYLLAERPPSRHREQSGAELNVIKSWLGHVSITTTSEYIEIDMAMKRKAIERCPPLVPDPEGETRWHVNKDIIQWLEDL